MYSEEDKSLEDILSTVDMTLPEMFKIPNIISKIKMRLQLFVDFCLHN